MSSSKPTFTFLSWVCDDETEDEVEFVLPGKYVVCPTCEGSGTQMMEGLRGVAITEEDRDQHWSPDEWDLYRSGGYDVECSRCNGKRVVVVPDVARCVLNADDNATYTRYLVNLETRRRDAEEDASNRRFGY